MAKYRQISDAEVAVGQPITQQLMHALKDNPKAIIENDSTAPTISYKALQSTAEPNAGEVIVAQAVGHFTTDDTSAMGISIRRVGTYRVRLTSRLGTATASGSDDGNIRQAAANIGFQRFSGTNSFTPYFLAYNSTVSRNRMTQQIDQRFETNDYILVVIDETAEMMEATVVLTVGVSDTNALYGVDAIPRIN